MTTTDEPIYATVVPARPAPLPVATPGGDLELRMRSVFEDAYTQAVTAGANAERQRITDAIDRHQAEAEDYGRRAIPALEARDWHTALTYVQRAANASDKATAMRLALDGTTQ